MPTNNPTTPGAIPLNVEVAAPELEVEFEEAEAPAPQATQATVTAVTPPARQELVAIYLLAMHLPSPDILATDYTDHLGGVVRRVKEWSGSEKDKARVIENLRRNTYRRIEKFWCMVREFGVWVAVSEAGVREAERLSTQVRDTLKKIGLDQFAHRYFVKAIRVYLHPDDAKMLLDAAVDQLRGEVDELRRRIDDAVKNNNRRLAKELMYKREYVRALLDVFKKYVEDISR